MKVSETQFSSSLAGLSTRGDMRKANLYQSQFWPGHSPCAAFLRYNEPTHMMETSMNSFKHFLGIAALAAIVVSGRIKLTHLGSLQTDPPFAALF